MKMLSVSIDWSYTKEHRDAMASLVRKICNGFIFTDFENADGVKMVVAADVKNEKILTALSNADCLYCKEFKKECH